MKFIAVADYTKYSCQIKDINFAPTLMFGTRTYKFALRNESTTQMKFLFKICSGETGRLDAGPYSLAPREGTVAPGCDV